MLKKILLQSIAISGTLFASLYLLLALQGTKTVQIEFEDRKLFVGELKDVIAPPVGGILCLGVGLAGGAVLAWREAAIKSDKLEKQLSHMQKLIAEKDSEIEAIRLSPLNPELAQLSWFMEDGSIDLSPSRQRVIYQPAVIQSSPIVSEPLVFTDQTPNNQTTNVGK